MSTAIDHSISYVKDVRRNPETRDWDAYVIIDGVEEYLGSRGRSWEAEALCDQYVRGQLERQPVAAPVVCEEAAEAESDEEDVPVGSIHGIPVYGRYFNDPGQSYHGELYAVEIEWNDRVIELRIDGDTLNIDPLEPAELCGDIHLSDWQWLRALAQTDVVEQLWALARGEGDPPSPSSPLISIVPHICDDTVDPRCGKEVVWVDYVVDTPAGKVEATLFDGQAPGLFTDEFDLGELAGWAQRVPAIVALLNHPDVRAAMVRWEAGAPPKKAA